MADLSLENSISQAIISIVSTKSGMGKTTLLEKLIAIFKGKNYSVGVIKHDAHKFEIDKKGKDSYRFAAAGADTVVLSSSEKLAMIRKVKKEKSIEELLELMKHIQLVFIEGFKSNSYPKIEVHRGGVDSQLLCMDGSFDKTTFIGIATDEPLRIEIEQFDLNSPDSIAEYIELNYLR